MATDVEIARPKRLRIRHDPGPHLALPTLRLVFVLLCVDILKVTQTIEPEKDARLRHHPSILRDPDETPEDPDAPDSGDRSPAEGVVNELESRLFKGRKVMVFGQITDKLARDVVSRVLALVDESAKPIQIYVNSPGGHVESGDSIHDIIKFVRSTVPIYMIGTGWVASRAHQDARAIGPNHRHRDRTVRRTSPQGHWNYWMSASEAIDYGVANEIISSIKDLK